MPSSVTIEGTARYAGLLLARAEGFQPLSKAVFFGQTKLFFFFTFLPNLGHFWSLVVTSKIFSSNLRKMPKIHRKKNKKKYRKAKKI